MTSVRAALPTEAETLTALAIRSKAHWGYDAQFMERAASDLQVTPAVIEEAKAFVAESGKVIVGFYVLVEPSAIGTGVGAQLWTHMLEQARGLGYRAVRIHSEPNAEGFYLKMGARRIGSVESSVVQ